MAPKTVKQLIEELQKLPEDTVVMYYGAEYQCDFRFVYETDYRLEPTFGCRGNVVILK